MKRKVHAFQKNEENESESKKKMRTEKTPLKAGPPKQIGVKERMVYS